jgi:hypothetical protein
MHSPAHDDRCKDYVINAYVTGEEYFAVDCVQNSKYDWCPRVRDWVLEARAQQAREHRQSRPLRTASACLAAHKAVMPNGIDSVTAKYVGKACV